MDKILESTKNLAGKLKIQTLNTMTMDGCMDVIVVRDKTGDLSSTPFHVRFGRLTGGAVIPGDRLVNLEVNGRILESITMRLDQNGMAFFSPSECYRPEEETCEKPSSLSFTLSARSIEKIHAKSWASFETLKVKSQDTTNTNFSQSSVPRDLNEYQRAAEALEEFVKNVKIDEIDVDKNVTYEKRSSVEVLKLRQNESSPDLGNPNLFTKPYYFRIKLSVDLSI